MTRRTFVAAMSAAAMAPPAVHAAEAAHLLFAGATAPQRSAYLFFNDVESRFIEPACARLIDPDTCGLCTLGAQVAGYLDRQLASPWGAGQWLYRTGLWQPGVAAVGLAGSSPAALFRNALQAIDRVFERRGKRFSTLDASSQLAFLRRLAAGTDMLDAAASAVFFDLLLGMTVEGFLTTAPLAQQRDVIAWPLKGFPGAYFREAGRL